MTAWTLDLRSAAIDLAGINTLAVEHRGELLRDVAERASQLFLVEVRHDLNGAQAGFIQALRSRLGDSYIRDLPEVAAFQRAWAIAWQASASEAAAAGYYQRSAARGDFAA